MTTMEKLAIHGGEPVRKEKIHYGRQYIDDADLAAVNAVLRSEMLTTGPAIEKLEGELCRLTGAKYAVSIANGTAALHAACFAAGVGEGDEVITTPITFAASANCALYCGATPVFADIDPLTYQISPQAIRDCVSSRTKAVVAVDFMGELADIEAIKEICRENKLCFIEDASHALGGTLDGQGVGSLADMTTFSFHPVKTVTGGEGGAILTNDGALYRRLSLFRTHGITRDPAEMRHAWEGPWYYEQIELGYNYRLTDFQAALISSQLDKLPRFAARRREIVAQYDRAFSQMPELILPQKQPNTEAVRHLYVLQLNPERLRCTRRAFFDALVGENVVPNVHYIPVYHHPYYESLGYRRGLCPHGETLYERMLSIPLYYGMTDGDVGSVIAAVEKVIAAYR